MGVKSTQRLTRAEAENLYVELKLEGKRAKFELKAKNFGSEELENLLEAMNDDAHGGEGFRNYIVEDGEPYDYY